MFNLLRKIKFIRKLMLKYPKTYNYIRKVVHILEQKEVSLLAPYLAYFILLSFIPTISLTFEVVFLIINSNSGLLETLEDVLPVYVHSILVGLIDNRSGPIPILTFSNIVLLYVASQIYLSFYTSYLLIYNIEPKKFYLKGRIVAFINTLLLIVLIFFLSLFTIFNKYFYHLIRQNLNYLFIDYLYSYINFILAIIIICSIVTFMMYSIPDFRQKIKDVFPGALFVTFGWIIVSFGFKVYTDYFADYRTVYKTFAAIIVFIVWIYLLSLVLIIGIVINRAKFTTHENDKNSKNSNEYTEGSEY
ncbi:MAG TPA: YihY/virulence factor BrkB family protein [Haloplasmataceae bacterium]